MKFLLMTSLVAFVTGCAVQKTKTTSEENILNPVKSFSVKEPKAPHQDHRKVVWELLSGESLTLQLKHLDRDKRVSLILKKGLSYHTMDPGHWELTGVETKGHSLYSINSSKRFIVSITPKTYVYAGSVVVGCPKIQGKDFKLLKSMKFFNRYAFSGEEKACEVIIGNDFAGVKNLHKNFQKSEKLGLILGF